MGNRRVHATRKLIGPGLGCSDRRGYVTQVSIPTLEMMCILPLVFAKVSMSSLVRIRLSPAPTSPCFHPWADPGAFPPKLVLLLSHPYPTDMGGLALTAGLSDLRGRDLAVCNLLHLARQSALASCTSSSSSSLSCRASGVTSTSSPSSRGGDAACSAGKPGDKQDESPAPDGVSRRARALSFGAAAVTGSQG